MKKVLVITYYWPPSGGAGVQRWLKFVKYLRDFGWEPVIFTPQNPELPETDLSLLEDIPPNVEIVKIPIWEPYSFYKKFTRKPKETRISAGFLKEDNKNKFADSISVWIRGNLFIPDARKFWIKPAIKFLTNYLKTNPINAIVSTGPPHSCHLIAYGLKQKFNIPWLADFRDPWTMIDFYHDLKLSAYADNKHKKLENTVLRNADSVVVISPTMAKEFESLYHKNYTVITNGYDDADYAIIQQIQPDKSFSISHVGSLVPSRNPRILWEVLAEMINSGHHIKNNLEIKLVGKVDYSVFEETEKLGLKSYINKTDYLPHHDVVSVQKKSQLLLLLINDTPNSKSILTGKFFEYLAAQRPILCIGPEDGDAAKILNECQAGTCVDYLNKEKLKKTIDTYYSEYLNGTLAINPKKTSQYSRKNLTQLLAIELNRIIKPNAQ